MGRGIAHRSEARRPRAGLHKRSAEGWGHPLSPRQGAALSMGLAFLMGAR